MELKRIDNLWHFFATQNELFLKKDIGSRVRYQVQKGDSVVVHTFNPNFPLQASLSVFTREFTLPAKTYRADKKVFGISTPPKLSHQRPFFPKELLTLSAKYCVQVDRDVRGALKVTLYPFHPKNIHEIRTPVNHITQTLWGFKYFAELVKN